MSETLGLTQSEARFNWKYNAGDIPTAETLNHHKEHYGAKPLLTARHQELIFGNRIDRSKTTATFAYAATAVYTAKAEEDGELISVGAIEVFPEHMSVSDVLRTIRFQGETLDQRAEAGFSERQFGTVALADGTKHTYVFNPDLSHLRETFYAEGPSSDASQLEDRAKTVGELAIAA